MKRTLGFTFLVLACIAGFLSIKGAMPFMPIYGSSMEPTLQSGSLMVIEPVDPHEVEIGDIIVYNVPSMVREYYGYPSVVAHRVKDVRTTPTLGFRTHGDNTGEDPFTIRPQDIRGTVGSQIPFMGIPLLFFQSQQGLIFTVIALALLAFFLYGGELSQGGRFMHRSIFAPVINEEKRTNRALTRKIEATEQKMNSTEMALEKFSSAVSEYAQHLASHTSAIQGLAEASHELKRGAAEQNRVLAHLMENVVQPGALRMVKPQQAAAEPEPAPAAYTPAPAPAPAPIPAPEPEPEPKAVAQPVAAAKASPPGCARKRPLTSDEILEKLKRPLEQR